MEKINIIILKNLNEHNIFVIKNLNNLRFSLTHGDANNYNLVVNKIQVVGLLDYGDMIYAPTINDLAVSLSYALMNKDNLSFNFKEYYKFLIIKFLILLLMKYFL